MLERVRRDVTELTPAATDPPVRLIDCINAAMRQQARPTAPARVSPAGARRMPPQDFAPGLPVRVAWRADTGFSHGDPGELLGLREAVPREGQFPQHAAEMSGVQG